MQYVIVITWALGICLIYMPKLKGNRPKDVGICIRQIHMCSRDLPDMYALSPRACSPLASGIHIRQIPRAYVTTITYIKTSGSESRGQEKVAIVLFTRFESIRVQWVLVQ